MRKYTSVNWVISCVKNVLVKLKKDRKFAPLAELTLQVAQYGAGR